MINRRAVDKLMKAVYPNDFMSRMYYWFMLEEKIRNEVFLSKIGASKLPIIHSDDVLHYTNKLVYKRGNNPGITYELADL